MCTITPQPEMIRDENETRARVPPTSELSTLNESESYQKDQVHNRTSMCGEELKTEIIPMVKELNTAQYMHGAGMVLNYKCGSAETQEDKKHCNKR